MHLSQPLNPINNMGSQSGFAPIVAIIIAVIILGMGVGGFVLISKNKTSSPPSLPEAKILPGGENSLQGVWVFKEVYAEDSATGELKLQPAQEGQKNSYMEFKGDMFCEGGQLDSERKPYPCSRYKPFSVSGDKIKIEDPSQPMTVGWKIISGNLELTLDLGSAGGNKIPKIKFVLTKTNLSPAPQAEIFLAPLPGQPSQTGNPPENYTNPKELLGWWEDEGSFPFMKEFSDKYFCTQYSSRSTCANNVRYYAEGNRILLEGSSGFSLYATWKMIGDKLELTDGMGSTGKSLYKKISPPTSSGKITAPAVTRPDLSQNPKPNFKLIKFGGGGICLKHDGGDSISVTRLSFEINDQSVSMLSFQQFPKIIDYIVDAGEFFVFAIQPIPPERFQTFHVGDKVEIIDQGNTIGGPWVVGKVMEESAPVLIGGLASCP